MVLSSRFPYARRYGWIRKQFLERGGGGYLENLNRNFYAHLLQRFSHLQYSILQ
jgi:hypothetical protein